MKRPLLIALVVAVGLGGFLYARRSQEPTPPPVSLEPEPMPAPDVIPGATLLEVLGNYTFAVTSSKPEVQRWFDQGLLTPGKMPISS